MVDLIQQIMTSQLEWCSITTAICGARYVNNNNNNSLKLLFIFYYFNHFFVAFFTVSLFFVLFNFDNSY